MLLAAAIVGIPVLDGLVFDSIPNEVYVSARAACRSLGLKIVHDPVTRLTEIQGKPVPVDQPCLLDGTLLLKASELPRESFKINIGSPRVEVDLSRQRFKAWQGAWLIMDIHTSSGRDSNETPTGDFKCGKKETMHISSLYGSKMPFSVHLTGNIFVHGSEQTLSGPGSHGCIRLPLFNGSARWFFDWVKPGTPVRVFGKRT